jgi:HK97 family phage portal protein
MAAMLDMQERSPWSDFWYTSAGGATNSGKNVTVEGSLAVSAVFAATRLIAESIGMLPIWIYERLPDRSKRPAPDHPLFDLLHDQPNYKHTAIEFVELMTGHAVLRGKAYAQKEDAGSRNMQLIPLNPDRVTERLSNTGKMEYVYRPEKDATKEIIYTSEDIFAVRGFGGVSVIQYARESVGLALAAEEHGARFFKQGTEIPFAVRHPGTLSEEAQKRLQAGIEKKYAGVKNHWGILILEEDMKIEKLGLTAEDSQYIESRKFQLGEIARWFRVPPHMLADLDRATFNNIEHLSLEFVRYTLLPWIIRWRQAIKRDLLFYDQHFADFKVDMLLLADHKSRYEGYQIGIQNGILSPNEARAFENLNPRPGGDSFWIPMNMTTVGGGGQPNIVPKPSNGERAESIAFATARGLVQKEIDTIIAKSPDYANDIAGWQKFVRSFYGRHRNELMGALALDKAAAQKYCDEQVGTLLEEGVQALDLWGLQRARELASRALEDKES